MQVTSCGASAAAARVTAAAAMTAVVVQPLLAPRSA